ncbi:PilN family type IVB pilus formation outer membrane protein [Billgrantia desiderata]|jgi:type IVB pilus formation R64 PilN family outer membrane protein|uniref:PilN family type IVB pilus formation outer membrane protein n=1 Tax=Billgrantia desiderata TaxID=52021 RepID=UPI001F15940C|nr:PilN family type IVB pilus formation outer membrane protein [Halomonas desiderata]MCE8013933.1 PilN family type IVB pilus formation outer membrane protein [Halomonas desiderata]
MNFHTLMRALAGCGMVLAVGGCAVQQANQRDAQVNNNYREAREQLAQLQADAAERRPFVRVRDRQWVDTTPIISSRQRLPEALNCRVSYAPYSPSGVYELTQIVQESCGVSVRLTSDAVEYLWGEHDRGNSSASTSSDGFYQGYPSGGGDYGPVSGSAADAVLMQALGIGGERPLGSRSLNDLVWSDEPLDRLLSGLSAHLGLSWKFEEEAGEVVLFHVTSRSFQIHAIESSTSISSTISSGTALGSTGAEGASGDNVTTGSAQSGITTSVELDHSLYDGIAGTVESMLSAYGRFHYSRATGRLTVTDTPDVIAEVARYVEGENEALGKPVMLDITLLSVTMDSSDSFGIDWDLLYSTAQGQIGWDGTISELGAGGQGSVRILDSGSRWNDSRVLIDALSTQGNVSLVSNHPISTTNLQPTPVSVSEQIGYLVRTSVTAMEGGQTTTEMVPGTVNVGLSLTAFPQIISERDMLLQFAMNLSQMRDLRVAESGDSRMEIPELIVRDFSQRVRLRSGQTLVLSGFEQESNRSNRRGVGTARNFLMGGGVQSQTSREVLVILITPHFQA